MPESTSAFFTDETELCFLVFWKWLYGSKPLLISRLSSIFHKNCFQPTTLPLHKKSVYHPMNTLAYPAPWFLLSINIPFYLLRRKPLLAFPKSKHEFSSFHIWGMIFLWQKYDLSSITPPFSSAEFSMLSLQKQTLACIAKKGFQQSYANCWNTPFGQI